MDSWSSRVRSATRCSSRSAPSRTRASLARRSVTSVTIISSAGQPSKTVGEAIRSTSRISPFLF
jgi:hypothetical protein